MLPARPIDDNRLHLKLIDRNIDFVVDRQVYLDHDIVQHTTLVCSWSSIIYCHRLSWISFKSEVFSAFMTLGPVMKYQNFLKENMKNLIRHLQHPTATPSFAHRRTIQIQSTLIYLQICRHMCTFCPTGRLQTSLLNHYLWSTIMDVIDPALANMLCFGYVSVVQSCREMRK